MDEHATSRPGDRELQQSIRAGIVAIVGWFFADLLSGLATPTGLALVYLLWLWTFLAAATCVLALWIGVWRRAH